MVFMHLSPVANRMRQKRCKRDALSVMHGLVRAGLWRRILKWRRHIATCLVFVHDLLMLDDRDRKILDLLQADSEMAVTDIADAVALSASACSRRITRLREEGYIDKSVAVLNRQKAGLPTTVFVIVRTGKHEAGWLEQFHAAVSTIPEIVEVHRLTGNFDYIIKLVLPNVEHYDVIYRQLVGRVELFDMSAYISMETVKLSTGLPTNYVENR
jgi:Lrp/AsnC family transcriptional regulator